MARRASPALVISNWYHLLENFQASPLEFYKSVEGALQKRQAPDVKVSRVDWREGGLLSAKREYLRIKRKTYIFDICGAPFGTGFFVSWWLGEKPPGLLGFLMAIPFIGRFFAWMIRPDTYYKIDTALMFQETVHNSVIEVVDGMTSAKGVRALTELERKPTMKEFYKK
jgi:hypothetical protein